MKVRIADINDIDELSDLRIEFHYYEQQYVPGLSIPKNTKLLKTQINQRNT